jgi:hypothetical protein
MKSGKSQEWLLIALPRVLHDLPCAKQSSVIFEAGEISDFHYERLFRAQSKPRSPVRVRVDLPPFDSIGNEGDTFACDTHLIGKKFNTCGRVCDEPLILRHRNSLETRHSFSAGVAFTPDASSDTSQSVRQPSYNVGPSGEWQQNIDPAFPQLTNDTWELAWPPKE